ncbi:uncharacterized protein LOC143883860 isoform X2 [Tasmannia lanceolata]|uniref:uncharacterized protein LOC143883860 isoform X2 n=1 Tax=Tasmannia lanceolata TaxID=3420 RepID=UPI0040631253
MKDRFQGIKAMDKGLISVDQWGKGSQAYFLTHLHADHTQGLSSKWNKGPLFCSPISANLFPTKFPDFNLSLLRVLEIGETHSIPLISPTSGSAITIRVTPIDAHHCPGAVMYLFRGEFGCMLHTGDFRWEKDSERALLGKIMLLKALEGDEVDLLYLDNTYCNPSFSFPPRKVAAQQVVDIITSHPDDDVIIGVDTLGKEDLLLHISHVLKTKIWVWPERLHTMHLLGFGDVFTTKTCLTRVRAVPRYSFTIETLEALNKIRPTIGVMPSGLPWRVRTLNGKDASLGSSLSFSCKRKEKTDGRICLGRSQLDENSSSPERIHRYIYSVPYSDHSCFSEIGDFIKLVQPSKISGIVSSSCCYVNPRYYFGNLSGPNKQSVQSLKKFRRSGPAELVKFIQTDAVNKERTMRDTCREVRRSRVSILRRQRHGVKIEEVDSICRSDMDAGIT